MCIRINLFMNHSLLTLDGFFFFSLFCGRYQCNMRHSIAHWIARSCEASWLFYNRCWSLGRCLSGPRSRSTHKNSFSIIFFPFSTDENQMWIYLEFMDFSSPLFHSIHDLGCSVSHANLLTLFEIILISLRSFLLTPSTLRRYWNSFFVRHNVVEERQCFHDRFMKWILCTFFYARKKAGFLCWVEIAQRLTIFSCYLLGRTIDKSNFSRFYWELSRIFLSLLVLCLHSVHRQNNIESEFHEIVRHQKKKLSLIPLSTVFYSSGRCGVT